MNKVFKEKIGETLVVYIDDMSVKSSDEESHGQHLTRIFQRAQQLNSKKCTSRVRTGKFLRFYLTKRGIEENLDKCDIVIQINPPKSKKEVMKLNEMLTAFNRFFLKSAQHTLPFCKLLKKEAQFEYTPKF